MNFVVWRCTQPREKRNKAEGSSLTRGSFVMTRTNMSRRPYLISYKAVYQTVTPLTLTGMLVCLSVCMSVCLSVCLFVCLFFFLRLPPPSWSIRPARLLAPGPSKFKPFCCFWFYFITRPNAAVVVLFFFTYRANDWFAASVSSY